MVAHRLSVSVKSAIILEARSCTEQYHTSSWTYVARSVHALKPLYVYRIYRQQYRS